MTLKPCIQCGIPTNATRCDDCQADRDRHVDRRRGTATQRGYGARWSRLSRRARRRQPWCLDCGTRDDLTADHKTWPATSLEHVDVVCRPCNSKRGAIRTNPKETTP